MRIIIAAPSYHTSSGGTLVLHKLCHVLNTIGYDSYLYPTLKLNNNLEHFILNPQYNTKISNEINCEKDIVIYPEIEHGNPFECKNVIRYILNNNHLPNKDNSLITWEEKDYWLYLHEHFYDGLRDKNILLIIESNLDIFKDYNLERKIEACFTYRKRNNELQNLTIIHPQNAIEIKFHTPNSELINIFNSCKRFYSYDTKTYLNVLASLCGCESIIVPYKKIKKEDIIFKQPTLKYGIAYGLEDLEHAHSTKHLLRNFLQNIEDKQYENTKISFEKIIKYFNL